MDVAWFHCSQCAVMCLLSPWIKDAREVNSDLSARQMPGTNVYSVRHFSCYFVTILWLIGQELMMEKGD